MGGTLGFVGRIICLDYYSPPDSSMATFLALFTALGQVCSVGCCWLGELGPQQFETRAHVGGCGIIGTMCSPLFPGHD